MDVRGAVELSLPAIDISGPEPLTSRELDRVAQWAADWGWTPSEWVQFHLTKLAVAAALESRLLHVRSGRLGYFSLAADPGRVTLAQLAALTRDHHGMRGQAFELAVADAVQRDVWSVVEPLVRGLRLLGADTGGPLDMIVLGLEKIPAEQATAFYAEVSRMLPEDGVLRNGLRGRPLSKTGALDRLADTTWSTMGPGNPYARTTVSQLGRADAFLTSGSNIVPVSMKINRGSVPAHGWRDVPLWITTGPQDEVVRRPSDVPHIIVTLGNQGAWFRAFMAAVDIVTEALASADRGWLGVALEDGASLVLLKTLWRMRTEPIAAITEALRANMHGGMLDLYGPQVLAQPETLSLETLAIPDLVEAWRRDAHSGALITSQSHLFPVSEAA